MSVVRPLISEWNLYRPSQSPASPMCLARRLIIADSQSKRRELITLSAIIWRRLLADSFRQKLLEVRADRRGLRKSWCPDCCAIHWQIKSSGIKVPAAREPNRHIRRQSSGVQIRSGKYPDNRSQSRTAREPTVTNGNIGTACLAKANAANCAHSPSPVNRASAHYQTCRPLPKRATRSCHLIRGSLYVRSGTPTAVPDKLAAAIKQVVESNEFKTGRRNRAVQRSI